MDYATIHKLIEASGYKKVGTESVIISYTTNYIKNTDRIEVKWELGGYVRSIAISDVNGESKLFESAELFIETFS